MIKTFRGLLADASQDIIRLSTKKGKIGYRIVKLQTVPASPFNATQESIIKIFKVTQTTITGTVDFADHNLLAVGIFKQHDSTNYMAFESVIFDNEIFNQDIYITNYDAATGEAINYYMELETMPLSDNAAAVSTLRDIRLNPQVGA
jgi:hypothetical protein